MLVSCSSCGEVSTDTRLRNTILQPFWRKHAVLRVVRQFQGTTFLWGTPELLAIKLPTIAVQTKATAKVLKVL